MLQDALPINPDFLSSQIGFEIGTRAAQLILLEGVNDELAAQEELWAGSDLALQELLGGGPGQTDLERFETTAFHAGPHKSFLKAPPAAFPNVSVMAYYTQPEAVQFDQIDNMQLRLYVEVICKAGPISSEGSTEHSDFETIVHRRIERTTEAVHAVLRRDPTLRGTVLPTEVPPRGGIGDQSWVRREEKGSGPRYLMQGSRLEYTLQRQARFP